MASGRTDVLEGQMSGEVTGGSDPPFKGGRQGQSVKCPREGSCPLPTHLSSPLQPPWLSVPSQQRGQTHDPELHQLSHRREEKTAPCVTSGPVSVARISQEPCCRACGPTMGDSDVPWQGPAGRPLGRSPWHMGSQYRPACPQRAQGH